MDDDFQSYYHDGTFSHYHATTIDPSPWALITTLCFCIALVLLLPLCVAIQQYSHKQKRKQAQAVSDLNKLYAPPAIEKPVTNKPSVVDHAPLKQRQESNTELASVSFPIPHRDTSKQDDFLTSMDNPFCYVEEDSTFNALYDGQDNDDESLHGLGTEGTKGDLWEDDPLPTRPAAGLRRAEGLASLLKRAVGKKPVTTTVAEEEEEAQTNYVSMRDNTNSMAKNARALLREEEEDDDDNLLSYSSSSEGDGLDLVTQLVGEYDQLNGIDDGDDETETGEFPPHKLGTLNQPNPSRTQNTSAQPATPTSGIYDVALCYGKRPWYGYFVSRGFLRKLWKCASWDDEMKKIAGLVVPYTLHAAVTHVFELMEIVVIGHLIAGNNAKVLGAYFAVDFVLSLSTMFLEGAVNSLNILLGHAVGARNFELAGKYVHLAILLHQVILLPIAVVSWNRIGDLVFWLGFEEDEATEGEGYGRVAILAIAVDVYNKALHQMLHVTGFEWYSSVMDMIHSFASLAGVFVVGWLVNNTPLWMVGAVHLFVALLFGLVNVSIIVSRQWLMGFWNGFYSFALRDGRAVRTFVRTAAPLSLGYVTEYCQWEMLFAFAAAQGPAEVAVWGLLGCVWEFSVHIGEAIADAAEVRVATLLRSQRSGLARYSSHKSLLLGVLTALFMATVILGVRNFLPTWLTTDETLQSMLSDLLPLVCVGLAVLTFGSMSWTILCAQGRMRLATAITFLGSVCVTLPLAVASTFVLNFNLEGLLASIVIGCALSGIVNSFIMITSKWEKISEKVSKRSKKRIAESNAGETPKVKQKPRAIEMKQTRQPVRVDDQSIEVELSHIKDIMPSILNTTTETVEDEDEDDASGSSYANYDWHELPRDIRAAAKVLGYTRRKWDHSLPTKFNDYEWKDLSSEQQDAALLLGYPQSRWDQWESGMGDC